MSTTFGCLDFSRIAICTASASQAPHDQHQGCHLRSRQVDQAAAWRTIFTIGNSMPTELPTHFSPILHHDATCTHGPCTLYCDRLHCPMCLSTHLIHECPDFLLPQAARLQHLDSHWQHIVQASSEHRPKRPCTPAQGTQAPS